MTTLALLAAAALSFTLAAIHSWLGETRLIRPLLAERAGMLGRSRFAGSTVRWAWHLTSLAWGGLGGVLAALALPPADQTRAVPIALAATFLATAAVIALSSRWKHFAWPIFVAMAGLSLVPLL